MRILNDYLIFRTDLDIPIPDKRQAKGYTAVAFTLANSQILRNLGLDAPSPIRTNYKWVGRYTPYQHQMNTSEFFTLNKRAFCLSGMGCISGDAEISCSRASKTFKIPLRDLYRRWTKKPGFSQWKCRSLLGDRFGLNDIEDVLFKGFQSTLLITLADGKNIRVTPDHHMAQPAGTWKAAGDLVVGDVLVTNGGVLDKDGYIRVHAKTPPRAGKDRHLSHDPYLKLDGGRTKNGGTIVVVPKKSEVVSISDGGVIDVYDLCMAAPHHNFVANKIVVHNSGKTMSALWAADYLKKMGVVNRVLIVAPLSTIDVVWARELFTNFTGRSYNVLHGSADKRRQLLAEPQDYYVINHHGLKVLEAELIAREDINLIIFDELAIFRNAQTSLFKSAKNILTANRWGWGMTGSPTPQAPTDAFGQAKLIKPENVPFSFTRFKQDIMLQVSPFKWVPRKNAEDAVARVLNPSIRYALRDCIDLPETIIQYRKVEMTTEQKHHYTKLLKECITEVKGTQVTAVNAAVLLGKIIQAATGVLYGPNHEILKIDCEHRIAEVVEIIEECNEKVIVFVPLTGALHFVKAELEKRGYNCGLIEGDTSKHQRQIVFDAFQFGDKMQILCAQPGAMSHGVTLTAASTTVWFAPAFSNETYMQANARTIRPGQTKVTNIINIMAVREEQAIYEGLQSKAKFQDIVLAIAKEK